MRLFVRLRRSPWNRVDEFITLLNALFNFIKPIHVSTYLLRKPKQRYIHAYTNKLR